MVHSTTTWALRALTAFLAALSVAAPVSIAGGEEHLVSISVGAYDLVRREDDAGNVGLDYRMPWIGFRHLRPWIGLLSTSDEAVWGGGGLYYDWQLTERLQLTPSFGAGLYDDGVGKDLGHTLEFRSQLDVVYRFRNEIRVGFNFGHLSNAGLADSNKGTEYFNLTYTLPLGRKRPGAPVADIERVAADAPAE